MPADTQGFPLPTFAVRQDGVCVHLGGNTDWNGVPLRLPDVSELDLSSVFEPGSIWSSLTDEPIGIPGETVRWLVFPPQDPEYRCVLVAVPWELENPVLRLLEHEGNGLDVASFSMDGEILFSSRAARAQFSSNPMPHDLLHLIRSGCQSDFEQRETTVLGDGTTRRVVRHFFPLPGMAQGLAATCMTARVEDGSKNTVQVAANDLIIQSMSEPVAFVDRYLRHVRVNQAYARLFRILPHQVEGRQLQELLGQDVYQSIFETPVGLVLSGTETHLEYAREQGEKTAHYAVHLTPVPRVSGEVAGFLAIYHDIGIHKQMERLLRNAKESAEKAGEAKSNFVAILSHELRTPLTAILSLAEALRLQDLPHDSRELVELTAQAGGSLMRIMDGILDYSLLERGKFRITPGTTDLSAVVRGCCQVLSTEARQKGISLEFRGDDVPLVEADARVVEHLAYNLIGNAVKFTASGGVEASLTATPDPDGTAEILLRIADTGIGIASEVEDHLFAMFYQGDSSTRRKYGGTGIGLAVTKRLAELMHGSVWYEPNHPCGSVFYVRLRFPLSGETTHAP